MVHIPRWAALLRDISRPVIEPLLPGPELPATFHDESHHRRAIDPWLVQESLGLPRSSARSLSDTPEVRLWRAISDPDLPVEPLRTPHGSGTLLIHPADATIEVFTETDLAALHALWSVARARGRADLARACLSAAEWHLAELQPDNATQSPWAIHVFVVLAEFRGHPSAICDAEMRLHNCLVGRRHPDQRSALILHHAARELDLLSASLNGGAWWDQTA